MKPKRQDLNNYNFPVLLGFKNAEDKDILRINNQLGALVWEEFLLEGLEKEMGEQGVKQVNDMVAGNSKSDEVINFIVSQVPNLKEILGYILIRVKKEIIEGYYQKMLEDTDRALFYPSISEKEKESVRERKNKYLAAKELFEKEDWQNLYKLMSG